MEFTRHLRTSGVIDGKSRETKTLNVTPTDMNSYFSSIGNSYNVCPGMLAFYRKNVWDKVKRAFQFRKLSESKVKSVINNFSTSAFGTDGISNYMVRAVSPLCLSAITHDVSLSLLSGYFPTEEKSLVIPLPEIYNPCVVSDFRPIST